MGLTSYYADLYILPKAGYTRKGTLCAGIKLFPLTKGGYRGLCFSLIILQPPYPLVYSSQVLFIIFIITIKINLIVANGRRA
jgi:hypothetical protein